MIDDSPSMLDKQTNLKNNFPNFINVLNSVDGGLPNIHLGVVSSDVGTKGSLDATAGPGIGSGPGSCSGNGKAGNLQTNGSVTISGNFIADIKNTDGTRTVNYTGTLAEAFSSIASLGSYGCGFEQHLEAARLALDNNPNNASFLRPNANLALVFVQDEDDCSFAHSTLLGSDTATLGPLQSFRCNRFGHLCAQGGTTSDEMNQVGPKSGCASNENSPYLMRVDDYVTFFKGLKSDPTSVVVAGIAGSPLPYEVELRTPPGGGAALPAIMHSCSYTGANGPEVADPGVRLVQFLNGFPNRNTFQTICTQDLSAAIVEVADLFRRVVGTSCLGGPLPDIDPNQAGIQSDCVVTETVDPIVTVLPACDNTSAPASSTNKPCWAIESDPASCSTGGGDKLVIERTTAPSPAARIEMRCKV